MIMDSMSINALTVLHDHYKDTFSYIKQKERQRDRTFYLVVVIIGFLFLGVTYPTTVKEIFTEGTIANIGFDPSKLPVGILVSIGWSVLFMLVLKHCQSSISIERQYKYLHTLESKLAVQAGDEELYQREGSSYLSNYPLFLNWVYLFHTTIFPMIVFIVCLILLISEYSSNQNIFYEPYDSVMLAGITVSLFLHRMWPIIRKTYVKILKKKHK